MKINFDDILPAGWTVHLQPLPDTKDFKRTRITFRCGELEVDLINESCLNKVVVSPEGTRVVGRHSYHASKLKDEVRKLIPLVQQAFDRYKEE